MCSKRRKNHGCGQKKPKSTSSAICGVETAAKSCELKRCARTEFEQNRRGKFELFAWTLSPNFFRLNWTFPLPPKRQLSVFLNFFFPLTNLFLTFVVFACFATTRLNMRFRAKNTWDLAQGYIQCMKCIGKPVVRTDGRTYVRTDGHVTITSLPKFLGLIGYQISLAMELRWRASALAPLKLGKTKPAKFCQQKPRNTRLFWENNNQAFYSIADFSFHFSTVSAF